MPLRTLLILVMISAVRVTLPAQNLVPNPGFECGENLCNPNHAASLYSVFACDWICPNHGTSDVFSVVNENKECWASMPSYNDDFNYYIGSQLPHTGQRFAGIYSYGSDPFGVAYREYLQTRLKEPIIAGEVYCAEMYASRAVGTYYAANNLGIHFSPNLVTSAPYDYHELRLDPSILHEEIITETADWVKIHGTFQVTETAQYLLIGNFFNDSESSAVFSMEYPGKTKAYYFIDDVSVEKMPYDFFAFDGDMSICQGDSLNIHAKAGTNYVAWTTLSDTSTVISEGPALVHKPDTTTYYRVTARGCDKVIVDTIAVTVYPRPETYLGKDTTICKGTYLTLSAGADAQDYRWNDNTSNSTLLADHAGKYSVETTNQFGCKAFDEITISVRELPHVDLGSDSLICYHEFPHIRAGSWYDTYEWSTGETDSILVPNVGGKYWITVTDRCGTARDTINIYTLEDLFIPNVLTLNTDSLNRYLQVQGTGPGHFGKMLLFNRWGQEIYSSNTYNNDWPEDPDDVPSETYYYVFEYPGCPSRKGWVKVMR